MNRSDPLDLLIQLKNKHNFDIDDALIKECYLIQKEHQFDKGRATSRIMEKLIEKSLQNNIEGDFV